MNVAQMELLLYYLRHFLYGLELHERFNWSTMAPDIHQFISDTTLCVYNASLYIHCYLVLNCTWQQNLHTSDYIPHTKWWLYCQRFIILYEQSWLATTHIAVSFQLIVNTLKLKLPIGIYYCTSLWVCCQAAKRNIN